MWFKWFLVGLFALGAVLTTASVGEERKPVSATSAAVVLAADMLLIAGLLYFWR